MQGYPILMKYATEQYYEKEDQRQRELGKKLLDYSLMKILCFYRRDIKEYEKISSRMPIFIIEKMKIDCEVWHFEMGIGECVLKGNPNHLESIEQEISIILGVNMRPSNEPFSVSMSTIQSNSSR